MYGKNNIETYIIICKIDSQQEFAVWVKKLKQGLCIYLEGWDGEEIGERLKREGILGGRRETLGSIDLCQ